MPERLRVVADVPDFGLGPASTFLALADAMSNADVNWTVVTGRTAARFIRSHWSKQIDVIDLDPFHQGNWVTILDLLPRDCRLVSITNPHFAAYAASHGRRTAIVDLLSWMWVDAPPTPSVELYLCQHYYGPQPLPANAVAVQPILDRTHWNDEHVRARPDVASVGLGGLNMPGAEAEAGRYAALLVNELGCRLAHEGVSTIHVFGSTAQIADAIPSRIGATTQVLVHDMAPVQDFARIVKQSHHYFVMPGLGAVSEAAVAGLEPMFLPGMSMSMLLQARDLQQMGYSNVLLWDWVEDYLRQALTTAEVTAMQWLADRLRQVTGHGFASSFEIPLSEFLQRPRQRSRRLAQVVLPEEGLPHAHQLLSDWLVRQ